MEVETVETLAKALPPYRPGKPNEVRERFFRRVVEWSGYTSDEYPFEKTTERILETVLKIDGEDKVECLIQLLSLIQFTTSVREKAFGEIEGILQTGSFAESEKERFKKRVYELRKRHDEASIIP